MTTNTGDSFVRKRNKIYKLDPNGNRILYFDCESVSKAKRKSRELQSRGHKMTVDHDDDPKPKRKRDTGDAADKFIRQKIREQQAAKVAEERARRGPNTITLSKAEERRLGVKQA